MVPFNLKVLVKFGLCSNCSLKCACSCSSNFCNCPYAGISLKFSALPCGGNIICIFETKIDTRNNVSSIKTGKPWGNMYTLRLSEIIKNPCLVYSVLDRPLRRLKPHRSLHSLSYSTLKLIRSTCDKSSTRYECMNVTLGLKYFVFLLTFYGY